MNKWSQSSLHSNQAVNSPLNYFASDQHYTGKREKCRTICTSQFSGFLFAFSCLSAVMV